MLLTVVEGGCWTVADVVAVMAGGCVAPEVSELATEGSSLKPGFVRLLSSCIAAAAACLVTLSSSSDGAWWGDPEVLDHTHLSGSIQKYFSVKGGS
jgi:hypothetical protein